MVREQFQILLAALLILIVGFVGYRILFGADDGIALVVMSTDGQVVRTDAVGQQTVAGAGMTLHPRDTLKVGAASHADLTVGDHTRLSLEAESTIRVVGVDPTGVRVELEEGRVRAVVSPASPGLSVTNRGRAVRADDADFSVAADADGGLVVTSIRGELSLQGFDGDDVLTAGQQLRGAPGRASVTQDIPIDLLLKLQWPEQAVVRRENDVILTADDEYRVQGRTAPYARIRLRCDDRERVGRADAEGRFLLSIPLIEGLNIIDVTADDANGRPQTKQVKVELDTLPPAAQVGEFRWNEGRR
ncbi:MAG: FecR domain-containing protein [Myxococcota bacterium]